MLRSSVLGRLMLVLLVSGFLCTTLCAADKDANNKREATKAKMKVLTKNAKTTKLTNKVAAGADEVDLFKAIEDGQIEVGVVQNEMKKGKLFVQNKTDKPLCVKIPEAFGTRPVLAQMGGANQQEQLLGNSGVMQQGGGNFMNVPAEKVMAVQYKSVCLEYGKPEPKNNSVYEIAPIEEVTDKEEVKMICSMLNQVDQRAAQFAVWHISSGVPMEKLASETVLHANGKRTTNFSQKEAMWGAQLVQFVQGKVAEKQNPQQMTPEQEDKMFQNYVPGGSF